MVQRTKYQEYPRLANGLLDDSTLEQHIKKLSKVAIQRIIKNALRYANAKSSRSAFDVPDGTTSQEETQIYEQAGQELYKYFIKHCVDPAVTAYQCYRKHFSVVAKDQYRNWMTQKARMNSGWRYQAIAKDAATQSGRFYSVSDIGTQEADFNATVEYREPDRVLTIYVSVKNRTSTMGGQDWPKAITALEDMAKTDKNRSGEYICVFGMAIEKGRRLIKRNQRTKKPHSDNTEIWRSDFFWPFFTNWTYEEIITAVLQVLTATEAADEIGGIVPEMLIESFGDCCIKASLLDGGGNFNSLEKLVKLFCGVKG